MRTLKIIASFSLMFFGLLGSFFIAINGKEVMDEKHPWDWVYISLFVLSLFFVLAGWVIVKYLGDKR